MVQEPGVVYATSVEGVHRSTNWGDTWSSSRIGLPSDFLLFDSLQAARSGGTTMLFGIMSSSALFKSLNAGASWTQVTVPLALLHSVAVHPADPLQLLVAGWTGSPARAWTSSEAATEARRGVPRCSPSRAAPASP